METAIRISEKLVSEAKNIPAYLEIKRFRETKITAYRIMKAT
jgi:hypothetical protein